MQIDAIKIDNFKLNIFKDSFLLFNNDDTFLNPIF